MKRAARIVLTHGLTVRAAFSFTDRAAPILMLHRFRDVDAGNGGHDPRALRANLAWLRANKCTPLSLTELLDRIAEGAPLGRAIVFTVDDGYADFARMAAPVFAEFDCPVTVFLTSGFLDGRQWMWWDRVAVALAALGRQAEVRRTTEALKLLPDAGKLDRVEALVRESGLDLPVAPPAQFAPMSWDDVRRLARAGVTFGPHTVTHPVLSRTSDEQSRFEIAESWRRVRAEAGDAAMPVFCYPNGERRDFGAREEAAVAAEGMRAGVSTCPGYASQRRAGGHGDSDLFRLPRFAYPDELPSFIQIASGVERAKLAVRAVLGRHS